MHKHSPDSTDRELRVHLNRAVNYIQEHFAEDLSLEKLASVARYSKFHFHRLFHEHFGETVNDCIRRVRLEHAACRLAADVGASISEVACGCGFSNAQNFARVFKAHFGYSPTSFRNKPDMVLVDSIQAKLAQAETEGQSPLKIEIKELSSCRVVYRRVIGPCRPETYEQPFNGLFLWAFERGIVRDFFLPIGAGWGDPERIPENIFIYDVCLAVSGDVEGEGDIRIQTLPGGRYAVLHCEDTWEKIVPESRRFAYEWLPANGHQPDARPFLTFFSNNSDTNPRKIAIVDICMPIKS